MKKKATGQFRQAFDEILALEAGRQLMTIAANYISHAYVVDESGSKPCLLKCPELHDAVVPPDDILGIVERLFDLADEYRERQREIERRFAPGERPASRATKRHAGSRLRAVG